MAAAPVPTGTVSLLVILVKYGNATPTATQAQANDFVFNKVDAWYAQTSYGQMQFTGQVTTPLTIPDPGGCNWPIIATEADQAAATAGYSPSNYALRIIDFPHRDDCQVPGRSDSLAGLADIGGPYVWLNDGLYNPTDGYSFLVPVHELGHGLGLNHAHSLTCAPDTLNLNCAIFGTVDDYGNSWDAMGTNWPGDAWGSAVEFSALTRQRLGWLTGRVADAHPQQSIHLSPLESASPTGSQAIRITTPLHEYWIEYRQPIGPDAFLANYPNITSGVLVDMRDDALLHDSGPLLLDMHPATPGDFGDAGLLPDETWSDPEGVFTLRVHAADATGITVDVLAGTVHAPGAPSNVTATAGNARATVQWSAPASNGGSPILGYRVTAHPGGTQQSGGADQASALFEDLTNSTSYTFTVEAENAAGWSPAAASDAVIPSPLAGKPSPPRNVAAVAGDGAADVSWDPPTADGGATIVEYSIWNGSELVGMEFPPTTHLHVTSLTNGTAYTFSVIATNGLNSSDAGFAHAVTPVATVVPTTEPTTQRPRMPRRPTLRNPQRPRPPPSRSRLKWRPDPDIGC